MSLLFAILLGTCETFVAVTVELLGFGLGAVAASDIIVGIGVRFDLRNLLDTFFANSA
ncbi:MAG: hypothetical protein HRU25_13125 [Psychrobium sp.]|nr:hypothetical protein [Psychrobium sp.]